MRNNRKYIIIIAVLLIIIGVLMGVFLGRHWWAPQSDGNDLEALNTPKEERILSNVRNTAIVQAVKQVGPAVVGVSTKVYDRDMFNRRVLVGESVGSGVIFDKRGYIVTNYHVVGTSDDVNVMLATNETITGKVIGRDEATDLAVIKVEREGLPMAEFGDSSSLVVGEPAIAIGNPLGLELRGTVTVGVISALNRTINPLEQHYSLIQTDAAINQGNSGGALVNAEGKVVGINSAKIANNGVEGLGFAIPINAARPILKELIAHGEIRRAYLGVWAVDQAIAARYGYEWPTGETGILVVKKDPRGPLGATDIASGDFLTAVNGNAITSLQELRQQIDAQAPGQKITLGYRHEGADRTTEVTLLEAR